MKLFLATLTLLASLTATAARCPDPEDFTCNQRKNCQTPWGYTLQNSDSVYAYSSSSVRAPDTCRGETRTCVEGYLTGSYTEISCTELPGTDDFE